MCAGGGCLEAYEEEVSRTKVNKRGTKKKWESEEREREREE